MPAKRKQDDETTTASEFPKSTHVKPGETVEDVAARLGITPEQLIERNGLRHELLSHGVVLHS